MTSTTRVVGGNFEILRRIGRGGMATVYLARQIDLDRDVALKELAAVHVADASAEKRFLLESRVAAHLNHPNIVTVYTYFVNDGTPYFAMEYLPQGSLRPLLDTLSPAQRYGVLEGVFAGLDHAQQRGVVHRDLKPENLLVTGEGKVKIADFGIAKLTDEQLRADRLTLAGATLGTPGYMSPEQVAGGNLGPQSDLYSVGCIAFEMLVGDVPFADSRTRDQHMRRHATERVPAPDEIDPDIDPQLSRWVATLTDLDPSRRFPNAHDAWQALEAVAHEHLGHRWNREARLGSSEPRPLTPAPFGSPPAPPSSDFKTYVDPDEDGPAAVFPAPAEPQPQRRTEPPVEKPVNNVPPVADPPLEPTLAPSTPSPAPIVEPSRRWWPIVLVLALLVVAAVVAAIVLLGDDDPQTPPPAGPRLELSSGPLEVQAPAGWRRLDDAPSIPGFPLRDAAAAAAGRTDDAGAIVVGLAPKAAHTPSLLSPALLRALGRTPAPTKVGDDRYVYTDLRPRGLGRGVSLYLTPTDGGVATIACVNPTVAAPGFDRQCQETADSLRMPDLKALPTAPNPAFSGKLEQAIRELGSDLRASRSRLADAKTSAGQSSSATAISAGYDDGAARLRRAAVSPADQSLNAGLREALQRAATRFQQLARAADAENARAYGDAKDSAESAERSVDAALNAARKAGYELRDDAYRPTRIPALRKQPATQPPRPTVTATATATPPVQTSTPDPDPPKTVTPSPTIIP